MVKLILASKSKVRKEILDKNNIDVDVYPSSVDEEPINLAEIKASRVSQKNFDTLVMGADSVIDLNGELISKPESRKEALNILKKLNGKKHNLVSSVCISKNGSMIWNHSEKATLTMKNFSDEDLKNYLSKISNESLFSYNVYQIEGEGKNLFLKIDGDEDTIMGLPIKKIKEYLDNYK